MKKTNNYKEKIFITGGLGYIGSEFAKQALQKGHTVCLYDSVIYEQNISRMLREISENNPRKLNPELIIGDTRNINLLKLSLEKFKPTLLLHFAELSSVYACNHHPAYTEEINYKASKQVLDLCEELGIRVFYNSSSSVYGTQREQRLMTENDALPEPTDYYCVNKLKMESYIKDKVRKNNNFKIIVFRPATVFGLSPRFRIELLPNHFTYLAISRKLIKVSDLNAYRAAIDIDELIKGYFQVISKGSWNHLIYNIGHYNYSKKEFALGIQQVAKCKIGQAPDIGDLRNLQIDCSLFNKEFQFHPDTPYTKSIQKVANWLKDNLENIENNNFSEMLNMPLDRWRQICD